MPVATAMSRPKAARPSSPGARRRRARTLNLAEATSLKPTITKLHLTSATTSNKKTLALQVPTLGKTTSDYTIPTAVNMESLPHRLLRRRPKHGENKWMRQLPTTTSPSDTMLYALGGSLPPPPLPAMPHPNYHTHSHIHSPSKLLMVQYSYRTTSSLSLDSNLPTIMVTDPESPEPTIVYTPDLSSREEDNGVCSVLALLDAEQRLPAIPNTPRWNQLGQASSRSVGNMVRLPSLVRGTVSDTPVHQRSRSFSDGKLSQVSLFNSSRLTDA